MKKRKKQNHKKLPDLAYLRQNYTYDPIKGHLYHADHQLNDKPAGYKDQRGYHHIRIQKKTYKLHRIVFYMFHGYDPGKKVIDHINGDKSDNRILNLRAVTHRQNVANTKASRERGNIPSLEPQAWRVLAMPV
tara:strand:- start:80 stop:478 length:399 start_codon:yes stop_codon:yes gene_type:complete